MIVFDLCCSLGHRFEAWFRDSASFERLAAAKEISCAICGDNRVEKALMAPAVHTKTASTFDDARDQANASPAGVRPGDQPETADKLAIETGRPAILQEKIVEAMQLLRKMQTHIEKNFEPVGKRFAEEAKKMHYGETEKRNIYGEATQEETQTLADEGIEIRQIPWLPSHDS